MKGLKLADTAFFGASSSFVPPNLANLVFWGRPSDLAGADGDAIGSFTDKSGNGNHATGTTTQRPTLKLSIVNGRSVLRFNGTSNRLAWPNMLNGNSAGEVFVVLKAAADPAGANKYLIWELGKTSAVSGAAHPFTGGQIQENFGSDVASGLLTSKPSTAAAFHIYSVTTQSNEMKLRWNGEIFGGWDKISPGFLTAPYLGGNNALSAFWDGDLAEILIYKSVNSDADRTTIYNYLSSLYSISITSPTLTYAPTDFSGLQAWWKADALSLNDGDPIGSWTDSSGNSKTLSASGSVRPTYKTSIYNGQPIARYDGTDDAMTHTNIALTGDLTIMAVVKMTAGVICGIGGTTDGASQVRVDSDGTMLFYNGSQVTALGWQYPRSDLKLVTWTRISNSVVCYQNGVEILTAGTRSGTFNQAILGPPAAVTTQFKGDIGEALVYNVGLTPSQLAKLYYTYFKPKWGLP